MNSAQANILKNLDDTFYEMACRYEHIFKHYYPAHGDTGFTERNLTCHFVSALEKTHGKENIIAWFEAPLADKKKHLDCLIFDLTNNAMILIEAKRISSPHKIHGINSDLNRMMIPNNCTKLNTGFKGNNSFDTKIAVVLADIWVGSGDKPYKPKAQIYNDWPKALQAVNGASIYPLKHKFEYPENYRLLYAASFI